MVREPLLDIRRQTDVALAGERCAALRRVRETMGLTNLKIMIPFCRRVEEARKVIEAMTEHGLKRG